MWIIKKSLATGKCAAAGTYVKIKSIRPSLGDTFSLWGDIADELFLPLAHSAAEAAAALSFLTLRAADF